MSRRTSTNELLEKLSKLDPVRSGDFGEPPQEPRHFAEKPGLAPPRGRRFAVAVAAVAGLALILIGMVALNPGSNGSTSVIATAAAVAGEQPYAPPGPGQYAYRTERWWQAAIPGQIADASPNGLEVDEISPAQPRDGTREVWLGPEGRGDLRSDELNEWPRCSAGDWLLALATHETCWSDIGGPEGMNLTFELPPQFLEAVGEEPPNPDISEFGADVNDLAGNRAALQAAVERLAGALGAEETVFQTLGDDDWVDWEAGSDVDGSARLRAVADLLANPLSSPELRSELFDYAGSIGGVETHEDATDPLGRHGASISVTDAPGDPSPIVMSLQQEVFTEPFSQYTDHGFELDLSGLEYRTEIIIDPDTSELLAERMVLLAADDPLIGRWLAEEGAPQTIYWRAFQPTVTVDEKGLAPGP